MTIAAIEHVVIDDKGVPRIAGSRIRVSQIAAEYEQHRDAEAVWKDHDHLSRAQIHAALSYYFDHKDQIDAERRDSLARHEAGVHAQQGDPLIQRLIRKLDKRESE